MRPRPTNTLLRAAGSSLDPDSRSFVLPSVALLALSRAFGRILV
jgi:hypothetical protein